MIYRGPTAPTEQTIEAELESRLLPADTPVKIHEVVGGERGVIVLTDDEDLTSKERARRLQVWCDVFKADSLREVEPRRRRGGSA